MDPLHRTILIIILLLGPTLIWLAIRAFRRSSSRRQREGAFRSGSTGVFEVMPTDEYWVCHHCGSLTRTQWKECYNCHAARTPTAPATAPSAVGVEVALAAPVAIAVVTERLPVMAERREAPPALSTANAAERHTDLAAVAGRRLRSRSGSEPLLRSLEGGLSSRSLGAVGATRPMRPAASLLTPMPMDQPPSLPPTGPGPRTQARPEAGEPAPVQRARAEKRRKRAAPPIPEESPEPARPATRGRTAVAAPTAAGASRPPVAPAASMTPIVSAGSMAHVAPPPVAPPPVPPPPTAPPPVAASAGSASATPVAASSATRHPPTRPDRAFAPEAARCPLFGLQDDVRSFLTMPNPSHRCHATPRPSEIPLEQQSLFCLSGRYRECDRYVVLAAVVAGKPLARH